MQDIETVNDLPRDRPVFIYGAGRAGRLLERLLTEAGGFDLRAYVQTDAPGGEQAPGRADASRTPIIALAQLDAAAPGPKTVVIASQWVYQIETLLLIDGVADAALFNAWPLCMERIQEEDNDKSFDYYFHTYGGFDLTTPRRADHVLLGDSFGYHLGWTQFFDPACFADRSVPAIYAADVEKLLPHCFSLRPKTIFTFVGWVDLTERVRRPFPRLLDDTRRARRAIRAQGASPVTISLIPMSPAIAGPHRGVHSVGYFNRCVAYFNREAAATAAADGAAFLDVAALLCDADGLRPEYAAKDGAHLNRPAARVIADTVAAFLAGVES
jgi:hypothetical protein